MSDWRDISTAPKDGTRVLVVLPTFTEKVHVGSYHVRERVDNGRVLLRVEGWQVGIFGGGVGEAEPTLWQPLPEPPV